MNLRLKNLSIWSIIIFSYLMFISVSLSAQETVIYSTDFESGGSGYTHSGGVDEWEWGTPVFGTDVVPHSGSNVWGTDLDGRVDFYHDGNLYSPPITLPAIDATQKLYVSFFGLIKVDGMSDRGTFYVSGNGSSWNELADLLYTMDIGYNSDGDPAEYDGRVGWKKYVFDVSNYAGGPLYLRFQCIKYGYDNWYGSPVHDMAGFYIDDVAITLIDGVDHHVQFDLEAWEDSYQGASCPWLMTWNGEGYDKTNDIYSTARNSQNEYVDYLMLDNGIVPDGDVYRMKVAELDEEISYTDFLYLKVIDYPDGVDVGCDNNGNIVTYGTPSGAITAVDQDGNDVLGDISASDDSGFHGFNESYIDLEFGAVTEGGPAKLIIKATGFVADFDFDGDQTVTTQLPGIYVQTQDADGTWADRGYFNPRFKSSTMVFDITDYFTGSVRLNIVSCHNNKYHLVDFVGLDASADVAVDIFDVNPSFASHSTSGDVMTALAASDDSYAITEFGEELELEFNIPAQTNSNRAFVFVSEGFYIVGPNTYFIFTWDGSDWVLRDAKSYQTAMYVDYTHSFDLSLFLPDPDGEYKVRIWQDYKYNRAAIDYVAMSVDATVGTLLSAYNWEYLPYNAECLSLLNASDNNHLTFVPYTISVRGRTRIVDVEFTGLPVCASVPEVSNIDVGGAEDIYNITSPNPPIEWDYFDFDADPQTEFAVQVWTNAGGSGTNLWNYTEASGATSVAYAGAPLAPGNSYFVRVRARDDESASCWSAWEETIFRTYCEDCEPPVIVRTDPTIALSSTSQTALADLTIEAYITDNVSVAATMLYYRTTGTADYTGVPMVNISGDLYRGIIPGAVVLEPGVDYYIWASDGTSSTTDPYTNPAANPYQIPVIPNEAPIVNHEPILTAPCGTSITVAAEVIDNTNYVNAVNLHYRMAGDFIYQIAAMTYSGGLYYGTIPSGYTMGTNVEYFIAAVDNYGVYTYAGTFDVPYSIALSGTCNTPPEVTSIESTPCGETTCDPTFTWVYYDAEGQPQTEFEVEVWSGAGGTGAILWNPPVMTGDDSGIDYDGLPLQIGNCYYFRIKVRDGILWSEWAEHEFCFQIQATGNINGFVLADCPQPGTGLLGVPVKLYDEFDMLVASTMSDEAGFYAFEEVNSGDYVVMINVPLGFVCENQFQEVSLAGGATLEVNFELACMEIPEGIFSWWWWRNQFKYQDMPWIHPSHIKITPEDVTLYCELIFEHFYMRSDEFAIRLDSVTYIGNPPRPITYEEMRDIFAMPYEDSYKFRFDRNLRANLLNIASGRMSQNKIVSVDGATASQAITYLVNLFLNAADYKEMYYAEIFLQFMHAGWMIPAGYIDLSTPNVMFKQDEDEEVPATMPSEFSLSQNYPNPFNPTTDISMNLPIASEWKITIYNISGQKVTQFGGQSEAGIVNVTWDASNQASGIYLYKAQAGAFSDTKKMVLLK